MIQVIVLIVCAHMTLHGVTLLMCLVNVTNMLNALVVVFVIELLETVDVSLDMKVLLANVLHVLIHALVMVNVLKSKTYHTKPLPSTGITICMETL